MEGKGQREHAQTTGGLRIPIPYTIITWLYAGSNASNLAPITELYNRTSSTGLYNRAPGTALYHPNTEQRTRCAT